MGLAGLGALLAAGVGGLGLVSSLDAVSDAAARWGFGQPWMLPVGIDVAIPVFTLANLLLIRMDMALSWVRFVPWVLTLVTCWLNIDAGRTLSAKLAHGTMPLLWVVFSEIAAHIYAVRIGAATGRRMDKIRAGRWLLAPFSTFGLWRRMTLWELTSYTDALARERARQLARADLREQHGRGWRWKTPRRHRVLLKLGDLDPIPTPAPAVGDAASSDAPPTAEQEAKRPPRRAAKPRGKAKNATKAPARTAAQLLEEARTATEGWADSDINAETLRTALHCSAKNSRTLRDALLAERAGARLHAVDPPDNPDSADDSGKGVAA
ncbi:DUF2637 domain-containing protein [Streptomyces triticagri]|uniref:DUF2637 domain-containing protein n=1 Tax=Streptomyces triticagri TaxID=2293568 RepID=A0A372LXL4_9ACTN|nr:DUF2637 domain-containing protein [Streptomyces triticagri]